MATLYKDTVKRVVGDRWDIPMTITQTVDGVTAPVTGLNVATIVSTIKHRDTGVQIWQGTRAGGQIVIDSDALGQITIIVPTATTATLGQRLYNMDVEVTSGGVTITPQRWFVQGIEGYS